MRRLLPRLLFPLLGLAALCAAQTSPPADAAVSLTGFTWDQVPVNLHFGQSKGDLSDAEIDFLAAHCRIITLEKMHGSRAHGSTEAGVADTARRLKQRNPGVKVLFYFNAFINWPGYEAGKTYRPEWNLRSASGEVMTHARSGTPRPDPSNADFREWWSDVVADQMRSGLIDGVFVDALPQAIAPGLATKLGAEKAAAVASGAREVVALTKRKIGPGKLLLANAPTRENFAGFIEWEGVDGVMIEHFAAFRRDRPEHIRADLDALALAASKGKFVVLKAWPGFTWLDPDAMKRPESELRELARARITFPLACFLVAAHPGAHFCYSWGYTERQGALVAYPELERPLGPPLGDAVRDGWTYRRDFAHASVFVDIEAKTARIDWKP